MKTYDIPKSGRRGTVVAFKSRFGQCERADVPIKTPRTAAQLRAQAEFGGASFGWNDLTDEQLDSWCEAGKKVRSHPRGGQSGPLTGQNFYTAINRNQALIGQPPILDPPARPAFGLNPVEGLSITQGSDGIALKLRVAKAPTGHILVFASRPYKAGRRYCDKWPKTTRRPRQGWKSGGFGPFPDPPCTRHARDMPETCTSQQHPEGGPKGRG